MRNTARNYGGIQDEDSRTFSVDEKRLQKKLRYFFMNPCQKWQEKRKFPGKLVLQLIKIILVTVQVRRLLFLHL